MPLTDFAQSVRLAGGYVFVAEGAAGVYIYPKNCTATDAGGGPEVTSGVRLLPAWPNLARETANWQLDLPRAANVRLEVFDVAGRRVRSVWSGSLAGGRHVLAWHGRDDSRHPVASGVYLVRLATPSGDAQGRVSWMR